MPTGIYNHKPHSQETIEKIRLSNLGKKRSIETCRRVRLSRLGKKMPTRSLEARIASGNARRGKPHPHKGWIQTRETREKIRKTLLGRKNPLNSGERHYLWKGGRSQSNLVRRSGSYKIWRESVFRRDNYTCQKYGIRGGRLHPHHILNFAQNPELRFEISNGITLSERAHNEFHSKYGRKNNTRAQLDAFLKELV